MEQADRKQIWNSQILLYEMLEARESRYKKQKELIREGKGTLVCLMLNVPGPVKVTALTVGHLNKEKRELLVGSKNPELP